MAEYDDVSNDDLKELIHFSTICVRMMAMNQPELNCFMGEQSEINCLEKYKSRRLASAKKAESDANLKMERLAEIRLDRCQNNEAKNLEKDIQLLKKIGIRDMRKSLAHTFVQYLNIGLNDKKRINIMGKECDCIILNDICKCNIVEGTICKCV